MSPQDFRLFADLLQRESGLALTEDKGYLLESRLTPVARRWNLAGLPQLTERLRGRPETGLVREVVEAMTTNESSFFRDTRPFQLLKDTILPELMAARSGMRALRIWSAAASSGQEPYSIAMILAELHARLAGWRIEILATDLSSEMIERGREGVYSQFEVQRGLPVTHLVRFFDQEGQRWRIKPALRQMVTWKVFNLLHDMTSLGSFDIVFCRNVLIYFDQPTKARVLGAIARRMAPDAVLFLGGAETVLGITEAFKPMDSARGAYVLARSAASASAQAARR